jgi:hypothetical protein
MNALATNKGSVDRKAENWSDRKGRLRLEALEISHENYTPTPFPTIPALTDEGVLATALDYLQSIDMQGVCSLQNLFTVVVIVRTHHPKAQWSPHRQSYPLSSR